MFQIAQRNHIAIPYQSVEEVRAAYQFHNLQSFLDIYYAGRGGVAARAGFFSI